MNIRRLGALEFIASTKRVERGHVRSCYESTPVLECLIEIRTVRKNGVKEHESNGFAFRAHDGTVFIPDCLNLNFIDC